MHVTETISLPAPVSEALDRWIEEQMDPKPSRPEAIKLAIVDWLVALGHISVRDAPQEPKPGD